MMSRDELKQLAREQIKGNIGILFVCMLIIGLITSAVSFTVVGTIVLAPVFSVSMVRIYLNLTKGRIPEIQDIFSGFDILVKAIILNLVMGLFIMLWALLFYIPGIIKAISYSMSTYILVENPEMSPTEAINESKRMMDGHKMDFFILMLSFLPWILLTMVTCGIAAIYVGPYMAATTANFYLDLKQQKSFD